MLPFAKSLNQLFQFKLKMVRHGNYLPRIPVTRFRTHHFRTSNPCCSASTSTSTQNQNKPNQIEQVPSHPEVTLSTTKNQHSNSPEPLCHELVQKLRILLQQERTGAAKRLIKSVILTKSPFSSPCDLIAVFSVHSPSLKHVFSNMLFMAFLDLNMTDDAIRLCTSMKKNGVVPAVATLNILFKLLMSSKEFKKTLDFFSELVESGIQPDSFMYGKAVEAAIKLGEMNKACDLVCCMKKIGINPTVFVYNVIISGFCKEKKMIDAQKIFDEMINRNVSPNLVTYNTIINGYCKARRLDKASF